MPKLAPTPLYWVLLAQTHGSGRFIAGSLVAVGTHQSDAIVQMPAEGDRKAHPSVPA